jgi:tRNA(Ser,Leu) C12 N-acetylase TAN1
MLDWNVVVSVRDQGYTRARQVLSTYGEVGRTEFYNVLVLRVADRQAFLDRFATMVAAVPDFLEIVSRVVPAAAVFRFQNAAEFEAKAKDTVLTWLAQLAGKSFHVRMHRRGFKERMSSQTEERFLDQILLEALEEAGTPGRIDFTDPDLVIDVETVGQQAGLALWTREDIARYPFLRID